MYKNTNLKIQLQKIKLQNMWIQKYSNKKYDNTKYANTIYANKNSTNTKRKTTKKKKKNKHKSLQNATLWHIFPPPDSHINWYREWKHPQQYPINETWPIVFNIWYYADCTDQAFEVWKGRHIEAMNATSKSFTPQIHRAAYPRSSSEITHLLLSPWRENLLRPPPHREIRSRVFCGTHCFQRTASLFVEYSVFRVEWNRVLLLRLVPIAFVSKLLTF